MKRPTWPHRHGEAAQSLVELALVTPLLLALVLAFAGAIQLLDATTEIKSATGLATLSAFSVPVGSTGEALQNVDDSFLRSVHSSYVVPGSLAITCPQSEGNEYIYATNYAPGTKVSCHGEATVSFAHSIIGVVWRWDVHIHQDAQLAAPPFRQCAQGVTC